MPCNVDTAPPPAYSHLCVARTKQNTYVLRVAHCCFSLALLLAARLQQQGVVQTLFCCRTGCAASPHVSTRRWIACTTRTAALLLRAWMRRAAAAADARARCCWTWFFHLWRRA